LPAQVQRALRDYRVRGRVTVDAAGVFPARDPGASTYHATVGLDDASGYWPKRDAGLDRLSLKLSADQRKPGLVRLTIAALDAASGDTTLRLDKAEVLLDGDAGTWGLAEVAGRVELGADGAGLPKQSRPLLAGMDASGRVDFTVAANGRLLPGENGELVAPQDVVLLAYPRGVTFRPPEWPEPIRNLGGGSV